VGVRRYDLAAIREMLGFQRDSSKEDRIEGRSFCQAFEKK
jgi:hypothetical protein